MYIQCKEWLGLNQTGSWDSSSVSFKSVSCPQKVVTATLWEKWRLGTKVCVTSRRTVRTFCAVFRHCFLYASQRKGPFCFWSAERFFVVSKAFFLQSCFCRWLTNLAKHNFLLPIVLALLLIRCVTVVWSEVYVSTEGRDINDFVCSWSFTPAKQFNLGSFYL